MRSLARLLLPVLVLAVGAMIALVIVKSKREVPRKETRSLAPLVRVMTAENRDFEVRISSQGTVTPRTESQLVAQVAGRITSVAPDFAAGGIFAKGDLLLSIESVDYEVAVIQARGLVADGELVLAQEAAEAKVARQEWEQLGQGDASALSTRDLQVKRAEASLASARAALRFAETNLARTKVRAPFRGRVRSKSVDLGQHVLPGTPLGRIFSDDVAEIRLPIVDRDLAFLQFNLSDGTLPGQTHVLLDAEFAGRRQSWEGRIVRIESAIDPQTRMVHLIASVDDPYRTTPGSPPFSAGLFVQASIAAAVLDNVIVLPREAVRDDDTVLVVKDGRIHIRPVEIARVERDVVAIASGIGDGDIICLSRMAVVSEGMEVRTAGIEATGSDPEGEETRGSSL